MNSKDNAANTAPRNNASQKASAGSPCENCSHNLYPGNPVCAGCKGKQLAARLTNVRRG